MIYRIEYHYKQSDHVLATPTFHHDEYVYSTTLKKIYSYVERQKDAYKNSFKLSKKRTFGFHFISKQGAVKLVRIKDIKTL